MARVWKRAREMINRLTPEQKLSQLNCMFAGGQIPAAILHRFVNGLGALAVMPADKRKEENLAAAEVRKHHCIISVKA